MTAKEITQAAKEHAKDILGEEQARSNKDAAAAIANDFKAGAKWAAGQLQGKKVN